MKGASTIFLQYFPLNMSIVWNNSLGEIGAKQSEYEKAAPSQYLHLGSSADEEMRDGAVGKFRNDRILYIKSFRIDIFMSSFHGSSTAEPSGSLDINKAICYNQNT